MTPTDDHTKRARRFRAPASYGLAAAAFLFVPLAVVAPMGESSLFALVSLAALVGLIAGRALHDMWRTWLAPVFAGLLVWALVSLLWTPDPGDSVRLWISLTLTFLGVLALSAAARRLPTIDGRIIENWLLAGFALGLALVIVELISDVALNRLSFELRYGHPDVVRAVLNRAIALAVLLAWPAAMILWRRGQRPWALGTLVAVAVVTLFAEAWAIRVACFAGLILATLAFFAGRRFTMILAGIAVLGVLSAPLWPQSFLAPARFESTLGDEHRYSGLHRLYIWEFTAERIAERPVAGWGLDAARRIPGGEGKLVGGGQLMQLHPHNGVLQVWLELGMPGAILLAVFLTGVLLSVNRRTGDRFMQAATVGAITAALVIACLSFGVWQNWWLSSLGLLTAFVLVATAPHAGVQPAD